jgi:starch-binding outer membrane protein, SusD/RagB family
MRKIFFKGKTIARALLIAGLTIGCGSELDQEVNGNLSEDEFYITEEDAMQGLIAVYDQYANTYNAIWSSMYLIREISSDDVNAGGSDQNDQAGHQQLDDFKHDASNDQIRDAWGNIWRGVYRANKVVQKTTPDTEIKKRIVAEARVLRAFMYMDLVSFWGGVPIVLVELKPEEYSTIARSSREEVLDMIASELELAIPDLPLKSAYGAGDRFRVSKGTAQGLLGKALLYAGKNTEAAAAFENVITSNEYELESDIMANFDKANEFGEESLFEINYIDFNGNDWGNYAWGNNTEDNIIVQLMGPRGDYYTKATADTLIGGWGFNTPTQSLYNAYTGAGDTYRRTRFVMSEAELEAAGGNWTNPGAWDYEGFFRRKYGSFNNQTGAPVGELNYATNWVLMRYADILLMAAEANHKAGNDTKAQEYLNMVRDRAGLGDVTATGAALFDAIVLERRLELAFEGHRWADLLRWGLADEAFAGNASFNAAKHTLFPIPQTDILASSLEQNPNY